MWFRYWPYGASFAAGVVMTLLVQVSWRHGCRAEPDAAWPFDLSIREDRTYRVLRVIDGDTLILENGLHVRYAGVNTPEKGRFVSEPAPLSAEATDRNRELVEGRHVRLRLGGTPVDAYGRLVARVAMVDADGSETDVEEVLISEGLGRVMGLGLPRDAYRRLKGLQAEARAARLGIWGLASPTSDGSVPPFCAASGGDIYHRTGCALAKRISPANWIGLGTLEEARGSGRKPCRLCQGKAGCNETTEEHR